MASAYMTNGTSALKSQRMEQGSNVVRFSKTAVSVAVKSLFGAFAEPRSYEGYSLDTGATKKDRFKTAMAVFIPATLTLLAIIAPAIF
mgnify:CR=1 FL=1